MGMGLFLGVFLAGVWVLLIPLLDSFGAFDYTSEEVLLMLKFGSVIMFCMGFVTGAVFSDI